MAYGLPEIKPANVVGGYAAGLEYGQAQAERERRQPIVEQLESLNLKQAEQSAKSGAQNITLRDMAIKEETRKRESEGLADFGKAASWASSQPDKAAAWDQALTYYEGQGQDLSRFRGREDLAEMVRDLNNPDYAKQQAIQKRIEALVMSAPEDKRARLSALYAVDPKAASKAYGENIFAGDQGKKLEGLVATLPEDQKAQVTSVYNADPDQGVKLATDLIKQKDKDAKAKASKTEKPKNATQSKAEGFYDRMMQSEKEIANILGEGYDPNFMDRASAGGTLTNWATSKEGQQYWNAASEWTRAKLRAESGAVIGMEEAREEARTYFPVAGDSSEIIAQKERSRKTSVNAMAKMGAVDTTSSDMSIDDLVNQYAD